MDELTIYDRFGKAALRLCGEVFYDYKGQPRGCLVGKTVYDSRGQHRGFFVARVLRDRMGKVVGFCDGARVEDLTLPECTIPPVPYKNLPAPDMHDGLDDKEFKGGPPMWSIMMLQNLLV